jgi:hypothetical protein
MCSKDFATKEELLVHGRQRHKGKKLARMLFVKFRGPMGWDHYQHNCWVEPGCDLAKCHIWFTCLMQPEWECFCENDDESVAAAAAKMRETVRRYFSSVAKKLEKFL